MITRILQVINLEVDHEINTFMHCANTIRCNYNRNISNFIKVGYKYVIELPDTKEILNVVCTAKGNNTANMVIKSMMKDGVIDTENDDYTISYQYEKFDTINFTSFAYRENCILYMSINDVFM